MWQSPRSRFAAKSFAFFVVCLAFPLRSLHAQSTAGSGAVIEQRSAGDAGTKLPSGPNPAYSAISPVRLGAAGKGSYYLHNLVSAGSVIGPAFEAGAVMASPPKGYPREWRQGASAYGRNLGSAFGRDQTAEFSRFVVGVALREDPRYYPSANRSIFARTIHAVGFTLVDRSDSGHLRPAFGNLAGATAGGFVGNAWLPSNYTDAKHAGLRAAVQLGNFAADNLTKEFAPELKRITQALTSPFRHKN